MFQELMELFKRLVIAHEKLADANSKLAGSMSGTNALTGPGAPLLTTTEAAEYIPQTEGLVLTQPGTVPAAPTGWDPYTAPVQKQYKGDKGAILKAELAKLGLDVGDKMTGAQMHELLLEQAKKAPLPDATVEAPRHHCLPPVQMPAPEMQMPQVPMAPPVAPPMAPPVAAPTLEPVLITLDDIRAVINTLCMKGDEARIEAMRLLNEVGGVSRLTDAATGQQLLPDEKFAPLYNALAEANGRM